MTSKKEELVILDGCYHRYPNTTGVRYQLKLFEDEFVFQAKGNLTEVRLDDVIGCHVMRFSDAHTDAGTTKDSAFFCIYAYHLATRKGIKGGLVRQRHTYIFEVDICATYDNNLRVARKWQSAVLWLLQGHRFLVENPGDEPPIPECLPAQRRYLCLVNPKSGPGKSLEIFLERVRPVLSEADISHLLLVTERINHAKDFVRSLELDQWCGIIIISGDGLLHEVCNGLMERPDAEEAIKIPIGMIPGGSGNGLARSICHASGEPYLVDPILACTLACVKGRVQPVDMFRIETPNKPPIYSLLSFGWGIMSDIDIESEKLRSIGEIRFTLWAFWRIFNLRTYSGRISYMPAKDRRVITSPATKKSSVPNSEVLSREENIVPIPRKPPPPMNTFAFGAEPDEMPSSSQGTNGSNFSRMTRSRSVMAGISQELREAVLERVDDKEIGRIEERQISIENSPCLSLELQRNNNEMLIGGPDANANETVGYSFPTLEEKVPDDWIVEEGRFVIIYSSLVSHLGTKLFFAPEARLDDGITWLMMIKGGASRRQILSYFINQEVGKHVDLPWVKIIPVRAFRLESFDDSIITIDGEIAHTDVVQGRVLAGKARILSF